MRVFKFVLMILAVWLSSSAATWAIQPEAAWLTGTTVPSLLLLPVLGKLGYRRRDALLLAVPVAGLFFFCCVLWRLASLPRRYWEGGGPNGVRQWSTPHRQRPAGSLQASAHRLTDHLRAFLGNLRRFQARRGSWQVHRIKLRFRGDVPNTVAVTVAVQCAREASSQTPIKQISRG
jgi:hypothetical protein